MNEQVFTVILVVAAAGGAAWWLVTQVVRGYRDALGEISTCPKCGGRRPGRFCSRCGFKKV
jgi:hypothetical protein